MSIGTAFRENTLGFLFEEKVVDECKPGSPEKQDCPDPLGIEGCCESYHMLLILLLKW